MVPVFDRLPILVEGRVCGEAKMPDGSFHIVSVVGKSWELDKTTSWGDMFEGILLSPERIKSLGVPPFTLASAKA